MLGVDGYDGVALFHQIASDRIAVAVGLRGTADDGNRHTAQRIAPRPRAIRFITGDLVWPPEPNERGRVSREAITQATADLRETLQDLFDEAQVWAGSPNER